MTAPAHPILLVIEDNQDLRETVCELLESESFTCWPAASADQALRDLDERQAVPDVILLDVVMPGMPAVDFVDRYRRRPGSDRTRIVFMTGLAAYSLPKSVTVDAVVRKPFTPEQLFRTLRSLL